MSKKGIVFSIISLVVVFILLLVVLLFGLFGNLNFSFKNEYKKVVFEKTYTDLNNIDIDTNVANIYIKKSTTDEYKVEIASKEKYVDVKNDNNNLTINVKGPKCKFMCLNTKASRVTIYIPGNYDKKITANLDMGDLRVGNFKKLKLEVDNDMGDVKIDGVSSLTGKVSMGDFKVKKIYDYINIKNNMGDVKIEDLTITKNSSIKSNMGDVKIEKTNEIYIDAHTSMGDTKVRKNERKGKYSLTIKNDMGDIKVNY